MTEKTIVLVDGVLTPKEEAKVSIFDRGFLYGDSVYEVTLTYEGVPLFFEEHLDRLWHSAEGLAMPLQFTRDEIKSQVKKGLEVMGVPRIYIRIIITRGAGEIGLDPALSDQQKIFIIFRELRPYPEKWYRDGVSVVVSDVIRNAKKAVDPNLKSGNYLNNVMAIRQAKEQGAYDAVMLNNEGLVTECTTANIWVVKDGTFYTPPVNAGLLGGITRQCLLELALVSELPAVVKNFNVDFLLAADEAFMTSSTREILPITHINGGDVGEGVPGPWTKKIHQIYKTHVKSRIKKGFR